ncbi:MAG: DUF4382 domain-containing protein [Dehalococcoidales bacterium]|nr:DUF4382 domain-containing protein [Dehalococcoidales bacterium]
MANDFDRILDECVDRINHGDSLEDCLSAYPAHAERLKPLLRSMCGVQQAFTFVPSADAKRVARQKFQDALGKQQKASSNPIFGLISRPIVWAAAVLIVVVVAGISVMRPGMNPPSLVSNPEGNFIFLVSDEPNAIGDFENLNVTISRVGLQDAQDTDNWIEFTPETNTVDLTQLQGANSQEIWRGDVPAGQYLQLFISVSEVRGKLKSTGQTIEVKLPSNKLQISEQFEVAPDSITRFTFDITVIQTGNGKYIIKPQIGESGAQQEQSIESKPGEIKDKKK